MSAVVASWASTPNSNINAKQFLLPQIRVFGGRADRSGSNYQNMDSPTYGAPITYSMSQPQAAPGFMKSAD